MQYYTYVSISGSKNNATTWTSENTAKLYFSSTMFNKIDPHINLESAILRLEIMIHYIP